MNTSTQSEFWISICLQVVGFVVIFLKIFSKSYITEKGKNLATKEDIGEITQIVESIKTSLSIKTEELKSELSYKSEHLIHLRAAERSAIMAYYKAISVLNLTISKSDLIKHEIDYYDKKTDTISKSDYLRYVNESEIALNKVKEGLSSLKLQKDLAEAELTFFDIDPNLTLTINNLNSLLLSLEKILLSAINLLLQIFKESCNKIDIGENIEGVILKTQETRSRAFADLYTERLPNFTLFRNFNDELKKILMQKLVSLTS